MDINDLDPRDYKYIVATPDESFNPRKNQAIIDETIKEADKFHKSQGQVIEDALGERIEAVAAYGCYRFNRGDKNIKQYLGDKLYTRLVGEKLIEKIRISQSVDRLNGSNKFKKPILL